MNLVNRTPRNILVTGGAGFIGCNFIHYLMTNPSSDFSGIIVNLDKLTYASNSENLSDIQDQFGNSRYFFEKGDICDKKLVSSLLKKYNIDTVVHFAAESHVDKSITSPENFINSNITGTFTLLECVKDFWKKEDGTWREDVLFHHISTDEVFGSLPLESNKKFSEISPYNPHSPYSASKASSDFLVLSYYTTYGLPVTLSNCSNNYGPFQNEEKFIPLIIKNILHGEKIPLYGSGNNVRDWIYVEDHNKAVWSIIKKSPAGERWNIGASCELNNKELLLKIMTAISEEKSISLDKMQALIEHVTDRPGHDLRYAIDSTKIKNELGWKPEITFEAGILQTLKYYLYF